MIEFVYYTDFELKNHKQVSNWLLSLANKEGFSIKNLYYNYVSPDQIQSLNNEFLNHDYVTDVLALTIVREASCLQRFLSANQK